MTIEDFEFERQRQRYTRETLGEVQRTWADHFRNTVARSFKWTTFDNVAKFAVVMPGTEGTWRTNAEYQIQRDAEAEGRSAVWLIPCIDGRFELCYRPLRPLGNQREAALQELLPAFLTRQSEGVWRVEGLGRTDALFLTQDLAQFAWLTDLTTRGTIVHNSEMKLSLARRWQPGLYASG